MKFEKCVSTFMDVTGQAMGFRLLVLKISTGIQMFKDMDLDLDHFLNLKQLITGEFTDTVGYIL